MKTVVARTHPREYRLHKYWSRKPHNVIRHFLEHLLGDSDSVVVDPFCGSGVALREASKLGHRAYGFDVNPVAVNISTLTTAPPDIQSFQDVVRPIIDGEFQRLCRTAYSDGKTDAFIRYVVHETVVDCECGAQVRYSRCERSGRRYLCLKCGESARLNLENLQTTHIHGYAVPDHSELITDRDRCDAQFERSGESFFADTAAFDFAFEENRRILASEGMTTSSLFTTRNFSLLCWLARRFHDIDDSAVRCAALCLLTASVAQCARLIPYRNNMKSGGPAWSVPGFWVPPRHLETNPYYHLRARLKKFERGLVELNTRADLAPAYVSQSTGEIGLRQLIDDEIGADLVFFDPPYGDSVPFLEFSKLWNSFLKSDPTAARDISVSDRTTTGGEWADFRRGIDKIVAATRDVLNDDGKLLITFNNHDYRAWTALLSSLQKNHLVCDQVTYQIPAVISSKAQFAPGKSYLGDLYAVMTVGDDDWTPPGSLQDVRADVQICASSRQGRVAYNLAMRAIAISWLRNNVSAELLEQRDALVDELFAPDPDDEDILIWRGDLLDDVASLHDVVRDLAAEALASGPIKWPDLYREIAGSTAHLGLPDPGELRHILRDTVEFKNRRCRLRKTSEQWFDR